MRQSSLLQTGSKFKTMDRLPCESSEAMHRGLEASLGCLQPKGFSYGPPCPRVYKGINNGVNGVKLANVESDNDGAISYDLLAIPSESCGRPVQQDSYYVWPALSPNYMKDLHIQSYLLDSYFYPGHYFGAHWIPQIPFHIDPQCSSFDYVLQDFHYFVVIDFEATCDKEQNPHPQEIIEFPSVLVNSRTGQVEDCFQIYVRPSHNKLLSEFCKDLTGIQQSQVDKGVLLSDALLMHDKWLEDKGIKHTNFAVVTWSNWDCRVMLESECRFKRIRKPPYFNSWINLKIPFNKLYGDGRRNLRDAVELAGLTWEGRAHSGLDDAKNTARLVTHLMHLGYKLAITSSLMWQSSDHPSAVHQHQQIPAPENNPTYQPQKWKPLTHFANDMPFQSRQASNPVQEPPVYCLCGATSVKRVFHKPGPKHGCSFFGCGNWTAHRGPACSFFKWVPASDSAKPA